ncbi:MAG: phosphatidate cytidylyltransferase [Acidimicrobiales bacterium]
MNDDNETGTDTDHETGGDTTIDGAEGTRGASIFDLFEPPPDLDDSRFVPIVDVDAEATSDEPPSDGVDPDGADPDDLDLAQADTAALQETAPDAAALDDDDDEFEDERADMAAIYELLPESERGDLAAASEESSGPATGENGGLPAWTEPPTGQIPLVGGIDDYETPGPTWKGEGPDDGSADDLAQVLGDDARDLTSGIARRITINDAEMPDAPAAGAPQRAGVAATTSADVDDGGRNVPQAVLVGVIVAGLALLAIWLGNVTTLALVVALAAAAVTELFVSMRRVGLRPANLLGLTAAVAMPLAVYHRGEAGFMLVTALVVVFGALWYIVGADSERPALNLGLTLLGTSWVAGLASFASLFLLADSGTEYLLAAVIPTVFCDTLAFAGGRTFGRTPFHHSSPNKTWEGTLTGVAGAVAGAFVVYLLEISAFSGTWTHALYLGLVVGVLCPLGDLVESMVKRDLGVKDMGTLLPGHGGVLDRIDSLLFVLPGAYYLARVLDLIG